MGHYGRERTRSSFGKTQETERAGVIVKSGEVKHSLKKMYREGGSRKRAS
jgi:hypothetical protein